MAENTSVPENNREKFTQYFQVPQLSEISWNKGTIGKLLILAAFQVITLSGIWFIGGIEELGFLPESSTNVAIPAIFLVQIVVESLLIVAAWRLYKRAPQWLQNIISKLLWLGVVALLPLSLFADGYPAVGVAVALVEAGIWFLVQLLKQRDLFWIFHNLVALVLSGCMAVVVGYLIHPALIEGLLLIMLLWDHIAVDRSGVMKDIVEFSSVAKVPNYFIIPRTWRLDMEKLRRVMRGEAEKDEVGVEEAIGTGDYGLPAALTAALVNNGMLMAATGSIAGMAAGLIVVGYVAEEREGGVPALPTIVSWTLSGVFLGLLLAFIGGGIS